MLCHGRLCRLRSLQPFASISDALFLRPPAVFAVLRRYVLCSPMISPTHWAVDRMDRWNLLYTRAVISIYCQCFNLEEGCVLFHRANRHLHWLPHCYPLWSTPSIITLAGLSSTRLYLSTNCVLGPPYLSFLGPTRANASLGCIIPQRGFYVIFLCSCVIPAIS